MKTIKRSFMLNENQKAFYVKSEDGLSVKLSIAISGMKARRLNGQDDSIWVDLSIKEFEKLYYNEYNSKERYLHYLTLDETGTLAAGSKAKTNPVNGESFYTTAMKIYDYEACRPAVQKLESTKVKRFFATALRVKSELHYTANSKEDADLVDGSKYGTDLDLQVNGISTVASSMPVTRIARACKELDKEVVIVDVHGQLDKMVDSEINSEAVLNAVVKCYKDPNGANISDIMETLESIKKDMKKDKTKRAILNILNLMYMGFTDEATGKQYYLLGTSASNIRKGGVYTFVEGLGSDKSPYENWKFIEETIRPLCFGMTREQYLHELGPKNKVVMLKYETGKFGLNAASGFFAVDTAEKLRGKQFAEMLDNTPFIATGDVIVNIDARDPEDRDPEEHSADRVLVYSDKKFLKPDYSPEGVKKAGNIALSFKCVKGIIKNICTDGTSYCTVKYKATELYGVGKLEKKDYQTFLERFALCKSEDDVRKDKVLHSIIKDKIVATQERFCRGVKGMVVPVLAMDFDPRIRALDIDIIITEKATKYITNSLQAQILAFAHKFEPEKKRDRTNYQQLIGTKIGKTDLSKAAYKEYKESIEPIFLSDASAQAFVGAAESLCGTDDTAESKLAVDFKLCGKLRNEIYHSKKLLEKAEKRIDEMGTGSIRTEAQFIHQVVDPVFCYHRLMIGLTEKAIEKCPEMEQEFRAIAETDAHFKSALGEDEIFCNGYLGQAAVFRNPQIHRSEPRRVEGVYVDYLWMYTELLIHTPYSMVEMSMGGSDNDGDKIFVVFSDLSEFNKAIVDAVYNEPYIIVDDDSLSAKKVYNSVFNRCATYARTCDSAKVGMITNWATCWTDLLENEDSTNTEKIERINNILIRLRYAQGMAIDAAKTGISEEGPDGNLFPKNILKPDWVPEWLYAASCLKGRPCAKTRKILLGQYKNPNFKNPDGKIPELIKEPFQDKDGEWKVIISTLYTGNSAMSYLHTFCKQLKKLAAAMAESKLEDPSAMLGLFDRLLAESGNKPASKEAMAEFSDTETFYRRRSSVIHAMHENDKIDDDQMSAMFDDLFAEVEQTVKNIVQRYNLSPETAGHAAYYAANTRPNNGKISEKSLRSFPWNCAYEYVVQLLYHMDHETALVRLNFDGDIESVEAVSGMLLVNGRLFKTDTGLENGEYPVTEYAGKRFIIVKRKVREHLKVKTRREYGCVTVEQGFSQLSNPNTGARISSEDFWAKVVSAGNIGEIRCDDSGYRLYLEGRPYATAQANPMAQLVKDAALEYKPVRIIATSSLTFKPKLDRPSTLWKDKDNGIAYCGFLKLRIALA